MNADRKMLRIFGRLSRTLGDFMVTLNTKDSKKFLAKIKRDLKKPVGPVPTPKIKNAEKLIRANMALRQELGE